MLLPMPLVKIERRRRDGACAKADLFEAVHQAIRAAFHTPPHDRTQRFVEYQAEDFEIPPGCSEALTIIEISAFAGRSLDAKRALYREIVSRTSALGIPSEDVFIVLHDVPLENWGLKGGQAACDVDFGFKIKV